MATITASDGRVWGYGRSGRPGGRPVLVHHGLIGDATLHPMMEELGQTHGLEWIILERPGYGQTPPMEMNRIADWPKMIAPVLIELGVAGEFDAIGISAGAPYAYALAADLPARVEQICILSGVPFLGSDGVLARYPDDGRAAYARYATADEGAMRAEFRKFCAAMAERFRDHADMSASLGAILSHDAAGPAREARLQAVAWGFKPNDIRCPVDIWHAREDDMVPYPAAQLSASSLQDATWHVQAEPSHMASDATLRAMANALSRSSK